MEVTTITTKTVRWSSSLAEIHYFIPPEKSLRDRMKTKLTKVKRSLSTSLDLQRLDLSRVLAGANDLQLNSSHENHGDNTSFRDFDSTKKWDELFKQAETASRAENMSRFSASSQELQVLGL